MDRWRCVARVELLDVEFIRGADDFDAAGGVPGRTSQTVPVTVAPEPTGVPGLTASDPFCAAWAAYAGTLQALGVAASFGNVGGAQLAALELAAAPRLVAVAAEIAASWPPELKAEQSVVIEQRIGPYARRAQRAVDALRTAGVTDDELTTLSSDLAAVVGGTRSASGGH